MFVLENGISCMSGNMALTIDLSEMFDLCIFGSPHNLGRGYVGFNVDLVLLGMLLFPLGS